MCKIRTFFPKTLDQALIVAERSGVVSAAARTSKVPRNQVNRPNVTFVD